MKKVANSSISDSGGSGMNGGIVIVASICIDLRVRDVISMAKVLYSPGNLLAMVSAALNQTLIWQGNANDKATDAGFAHVLGPWTWSILQDGPGTSNSVRIVLITQLGLARPHILYLIFNKNSQ